MPKSTFGFEQAEDSPGFLLWQTTTRWQRSISQALNAYDVSQSQFVILANLLWFEEKSLESTQAMITRQSKIDKMTVSIALKKMTVQNLVVREEHKLDTRSKTVTLTKKGKALALKLVPIVEKIDEHFFGILNKQDQKSLIKLLAKLATTQEA